MPTHKGPHTENQRSIIHNKPGLSLSYTLNQVHSGCSLDSRRHESVHHLPSIRLCSSFVCSMYSLFHQPHRRVSADHPPTSQPSVRGKQALKPARAISTGFTLRFHFTRRGELHYVSRSPFDRSLRLFVSSTFVDTRHLSAGRFAGCGYSAATMDNSLLTISEKRLGPPSPSSHSLVVEAWPPQARPSRTARQKTAAAAKPVRR